jgi:hypothetical protein
MLIICGINLMPTGICGKKFSVYWEYTEFVLDVRKNFEFANYMMNEN